MIALNLADGLRRVRDTVAAISPRRRRWDRFQRSLSLDPDRLPRPLQGPGPRDFIICGSPRSGTTLACAMLFQPPRVVTVMEPWDGMRLPPAQLWASLREEIATTERLRRGRLDVTALQKTGSVEWCQEGQDGWLMTLDDDYLLGVKWPAYWRYLKLLPDTKFVVCLRHPYETIGSYKRSGRRLAVGLDYDTAFNREMNSELLRATRDEAQRRVLLFEYVHTRMLPYLTRPNVFVLRYERWFDDREGLLAELSRFLDVSLGSGLPALRPARGGALLDESEMALIRQLCRTAEALGYSLAPVGAGATLGP